MATPYTACKLQRLMDRYRAPPENARSEADRLMDKAGFLDVAQHRPEWRLAKRGTNYRC